MFGRKSKESANPHDVHFIMVNGKPCFERALAVAYKGEKGHEEYDDKDLDRVAKHKFQIERFEQRQPELKGLYEVIERNRIYYLRFFPLVKSEKEDPYIDVSTVLFHLGD